MEPVGVSVAYPLNVAALLLDGILLSYSSGKE